MRGEIAFNTNPTAMEGGIFDNYSTTVAPPRLGLLLSICIISVRVCIQCSRLQSQWLLT